MSSLYADITGQGSVTAARMAIEDHGGKALGKPVEVIFADHQNKPDIAASLAREWFDTQKVDAILDVAASATALATVEIAKGKNKIVVMSGPGAARLTNEACSPVSVHYAYDTYSLAHTTGGATVKQGGDTDALWPRVLVQRWAAGRLREEPAMKARQLGTPDPSKLYTADGSLQL
jgi:branched-chain amino acid transport system substrate-binding protein